MELTQTKRDDGAVVLKIRGELDAITAPDVRKTFDDVAEEGPSRVVLDLSALRLVDSSGVGAIVSLFKRVRAGGGELTIEGLHGQPESIFKVLRLDRVFGLE